jgi:hypothetical protein
MAAFLFSCGTYMTHFGSKKMEWWDEWWFWG